VDAGRLSPASTGIVECVMRSLQRLGAARESGSEWQLEPTEELPEPSLIWRRLLADGPDLVAELSLAATLIYGLPKALADGPRSTPAWLAPAVDHLLQGSPGSIVGIDLLCDAVQEIAGKWPKHRQLRILELGARGAATRRILDRPAPSEGAGTDCATHPDPDLVARLELLGADCPAFAACRWSPSEGGERLAGSPFDLIIAVNACARMQLDPALLGDLADLLAPGGAFLAAEPEPNGFWDIVFGQIEGWWDSCGSSALRSGEEWRSGLAGRGFG